MDLYDIAVARKLSSGGGGGGSSDFSTAEVTISGQTSANLPVCIEAGGMKFLTAMTNPYSSGKYTVALWKGQCMCSIPDVASTSGSIENLTEDVYLITGDCTITIS